jgi:hypothetical protein
VTNERDVHASLIHLGRNSCQIEASHCQQHLLSTIRCYIFRNNTYIHGCDICSLQDLLPYNHSLYIYEIENIQEILNKDLVWIAPH